MSADGNGGKQQESGQKTAIQSTTGRIGSVLHQIPTLVVLLVIGAIGVWGHRTGWKAPHLSELRTPDSSAKEDWCTLHNVPLSRCVKCKPELLGENKKDWCPEHGVPESRCTLCHPEILQTGVAGDWCREHGVPETSCTICHPEIAVRSAPPAQESTVRVTRSQPAGTSPAPTSAPAQPTATGKPAKNPATCQTHSLKVQFASEAAIQKAGVCLGTVQERPMRTLVRVQSEAEYDRTHFVQLSLPVSGRVWRVDAEVGQTVRKGQVVALIDSVEVGKAKAELLEQLAELHLKTKSQERVQDLKNLESTARLEETAAAAQVARIRAFNARQTLRNWGLTIGDQMGADALDETQIRFLGLPSEVVKTLEAGSTTANLIPVTSPIDGTIISREAVGGETVAANKTLFTISSVQRMWVISDVPQSEMDHITVGQPITFAPDGERERRWKGRISWISTEIDDQTRTVRARAEVENADGKLRAHTFGTTEILVRDNPKAIVVPNDAIQWEGCCHIIFVRLADEIFGVRKVQPGTSDRFFTEIKVGVLPGEVIATAGSHVLTSEILKSALGAGCCGE